MGTGEVPPGVLAATASSLAQLEFALGTTDHGVTTSRLSNEVTAEPAADPDRYDSTPTPPADCRPAAESVLTNCQSAGSAPLASHNLTRNVVGDVPSNSNATRHTSPGLYDHGNATDDNDVVDAPSRRINVNVVKPAAARTRAE